MNNLSNEIRLLGLRGAQAGQSTNLEAAQTLIGRDPTQCQIVVNDENVSRRHAMITIDGQDKIVLADLGSRFGTFVNGAAIRRCELKAGDCLGFGSAEAKDFQFISGVQNHRAATGIITPQISNATNSVLRLGRWPDNDIVLDAPAVSRYHASLTYNSKEEPILSDIGSANGTFVNGEPVTKPHQINNGDRVTLGSFVLQIQGRNIKWHDLNESRICALHLTQELGGKTILKDISLAINQREFVGLMGPSGCGKSTLMDALNGLRPASSGTVFINELDLYTNFDALRRSIGHVPQRDILFDALSVERTLFHAAKLRLPAGLPPTHLQAVVDEVIVTVGLQEHRTTAFRQLSGGQQKRLSLGIELLTKPSFIFLDEPTSPLDPQTTENMMVLFRRLADEGRTVVMVTHRFEKFELLHQVAIMARGGHLAFFGPPLEALAYFGCREPGEIYRYIETCDPEQLSEAFKLSPQYQRYVVARIAETQATARTPAHYTSHPKLQGAERRFGFHQWLALTRRHLENKLQDTRSTALLFVQPVVIAILLALVAQGTMNDAKTLFITAIISIWFGANNTIREIVAEAPIYLRERAVNLKIPSYVFSKFTVFSVIGLAQCALFIGLLIGFGRLSLSDAGTLLVIVYLTTICGTAMGLLISAIVKSSEKALGALPLILIPQLLLSGFFMPLDDLYVNVSRGNKPATAAQYQQAQEAQAQAQNPHPIAAETAPPEVIRKVNDGMGLTRYASAVMIARWSLEALVHAVSINDQKARNDLATMLTVTEYEHIFKGESEDQITEAYAQRVGLDALLLTGFSLLFLCLAMIALKRKDKL